MKLILACALALVLQNAQAGPVFDKDFPCTTREKARQFVDDFRIDLKSFGGMELCNSSVDTKKLFNDLSLVEDGEFTGGLKNVFINENVSRDNYYTWLKEQTFGMRRGQDIPTATAYNSGGYFTMQDGWKELSTLGRVGVVIHEARHTQGFFHRICDHGPYSNSSNSGCDSSVSEGGAHGVEMEYYSRVALQGKNFSPIYQSMARLMNTARANFVFNESPMEHHEGLVALTDDTVIGVLNGQRFDVKLTSPALQSSRLKRTSFGVVLLNANQTADAIDFKVPEPSARIDDDYSYYKLLKRTGDPLPVVDVEEFDIGNQRFLLAINEKGELFSFLFARGEWRKGRKPITNFEKFLTRDPSGKAGIFVLTTAGEYCQIDIQAIACSSKYTMWPQGISRVVVSNSQILHLKDGQLLDAHTHLPYLPIDLKVRDVVEAPYYEVFD